MYNDGENPAIEEFEAGAMAEVDERKRHGLKCAKKLKKRAVDSRSVGELRFIMDGLLVLAGYTVRSVE